MDVIKLGGMQMDKTEDNVNYEELINQRDKLIKEV